MNLNSNLQQIHTKIRMLLVSGAIAGPLFTIAWILEDAARSNYNPLRHPVSSLALGDFGWMQIANFIIAGLLSLAFAVGLWLALRPQRGSTWGPLLIALWAAGLIGAGIFITDPVSGYPPGTPDVSLNPTIHGALHDQISLIGFLALTIACFVFGYSFAHQGEHKWSVYSVITGILFPVGIILSSIAFGQNESLVDFGGLFQRIAVTTGWTWLTLLSIHVLKTQITTKDFSQGNNQF
jgi:hypothetical protein